LWALLLTSCAAPKQKVDAEPLPAEGFSLVLNNRHPLDLSIFIQHDGQVTRVGMVPASSSRAMVLSAWLLGQSRVIRIIAEPIGEPDHYETDLLSIQPGQAIVVNVESKLSQSTYSIE
jgi:hypothetical protein